MTDNLPVLAPTVAIIGGGPAGLSAAARLASDVDVLVIEREQNAGGIPRHADHAGYGIRDRQRFMRGPAYAGVLVADAEAAGARILTGAMVTGWHDPDTLIATTSHGRVLIRPTVFLFATGARERPRTARMIPGDRPAGVMTTGQLQNLVHLHHADVGRRAVVVGAELVSWSAVMTLREAGCATEALVSRFPRGESYWAFRAVGSLGLQTRVLTNSAVVAIHGRGRVSAIEVVDSRTGLHSTVECDTVVFSGDWIADNELLRAGGIEIDPVSTGPVVDSTLRTSKPNLFSVGNLNHPVETADVVALEGTFVAERILAHLRSPAPVGQGARIQVQSPLRWISPGRLALTGQTAPRGRLVGWVDRFIARPTVIVTQGDRLLAKKKTMWPASPGRAFRIPVRWLAGAIPDGDTVQIAVT